MRTPPDAAKAATPRQPESMRERMARAVFAVGAKNLGNRLTWETCTAKYRELVYQEVDAMIDCLTAPPTPGMIEAGKDTQVSHCWSSKGEFISDPESIWEAMVRAMKEGK